MQKFKVWLLIAFLLLLDRGSKYLFYTLQYGSELPFLHPLLNTGISRGIAIPQLLIWIATLIGIWFFVYLWRAKYFGDRIFALFLAGTLGNFGDRVLLDGVRDFISIGSFPVFNLADCFLTGAVLFLLIKEIFPCNCKPKP